MEQTGGNLPAPSGGFLLLEGVDQFHRGVESHPLSAVLDRLDAKRSGDIGLSGAWPADQHDVVGLLHAPACSWQTRASLIWLLAKSKPVRSL